MVPRFRSLSAFIRFKNTCMRETFPYMQGPERDDLELFTQFIDCNNTELERRYNETRRRHPLARGRTAMDGIRAERDLLEPLRRWADMLIDTSELSANELQQFVRQNFETQEAGELSVTVLPDYANPYLIR